MGLNDEFLINKATWIKLNKLFKLMLIWFPFTSIVLVFIIWPIITNLSWTPAIVIPWFLTYISIIYFYRKWFIQSKFTVFVLFIAICSFEIFFVIISNACVFRFFGWHGFVLQNFLLFAIGFFFCRHYYHCWNRVWESHKKHNETTVLDLENGRYDFLNNFDMSEGVINKTRKWKLSNPPLFNLVFAIAPIGVAILLIFAKSKNYTTPIVILWILSVPFILFFLKLVVGVFLNFRKLSYYEKKIGKPIINGLLE